MKPSDDGRWELPEQLRISDPLVLAQSEQMRAELSKRAQSPFAHLTPHEAERHNAGIMATHLEGELQHLNEQIGRAIVSYSDGGMDELKEAKMAIAARLAEAYATLGRFDLAYEVDPRPEHRAEHLEILEAINRPDDEWCPCGPGRDHIKRDLILPNGERRILRACAGCKTLNAVTIPKHLAQQRGHRVKARAMVSGMSIEDAANHLRGKGHTHEKLISK